MPVEISPVKAPSFSQWRFCAEMAMFVFFAAATAAGIAVNGGATTMLQCLEAETRGTNVEKKARAAAGRDVGDFISYTRLMDGSDGIAAADDGSCAGGGGVGNGFGNFKRALGKGGHLENTHGAVPDNRFRSSKFLLIRFDCFRANIQAHPAIRSVVHGNNFRDGVGFEIGRAHV